MLSDQEFDFVKPLDWIGRTDSNPSMAAEKTLGHSTSSAYSSCKFSCQHLLSYRNPAGELSLEHWVGAVFPGASSISQEEYSADILASSTTCHPSIKLNLAFIFSLILYQCPCGNPKACRTLYGTSHFLTLKTVLMSTPSLSQLDWLVNTYPAMGNRAPAKVGTDVLPVKD
ncbi:hypothetical protein MJT46_011296 [Ovis ammon polii x Ovis aries]|nr:hypothetical protein MJT46_011296 [Ovis ammon polii x Ovis aries]